MTAVIVRTSLKSKEQHEETVQCMMGGPQVQQLKRFRVSLTISFIKKEVLDLFLKTERVEKGHLQGCSLRVKCS